VHVAAETTSADRAPPSTSHNRQKSHVGFDSHGRRELLSKTASLFQIYIKH